MFSTDHASGLNAIMATNTANRFKVYRRVIKLSRYPSPRAMAIIAFFCRGNVLWLFTLGNHTVVAPFAGTYDGRMIHCAGRYRPTYKLRGMAFLAKVVSRHMCVRFALRNCIVMAVYATPGNLLVIRFAPRGDGVSKFQIGAVACLTFVGRRDMFA